MREYETDPQGFRQDLTYLINVIRGLLKALFTLEYKCREEISWLKSRNSVLTNRLVKLELAQMELNAELHKLKGLRQSPEIEDTP